MSTNFATRLVQFTQFSGVEMNAHLILDEKPTRQDQKLKTLSKYVQQYPQGWKKRQELAELLYSTGHWQQAIDEYRQLIAQKPQLLDVRLQLGKILQMMGKDAEAIEVYESALPFLFNEATRHHIYGLIATCRGDSYKATTAFNLAASLEPEKIVHWLALGQTQMSRENPLGALQAFDQVLSLHPDDIVALIQSYDALMAVGNVPEAKKRLHKLIALAPDDLRVMQRQLDERCRMRLVCGEEGKQTKKMIVHALQQAPDMAEIHNLLAHYHIYRGDWSKGVQVLQEFTKQHPNQPNAWYYYGRCLFQIGEYYKAAEAIYKAYRLYPKDCEIHRILCEILPVISPLLFDPPKSPLKRGTSRAFCPPFQGGLGGSKACDETPEDLCIYARTHQENGVNLTLIVEEMLTRFPERWSVWVTAGRVLVEHFQEFERGCSVSEQATKLQPQLADAWLRHGRVLALAKKHQEAVEALENGWDLLPVGGYLQSVPAAVWLGESYQMLGDAAVSKQWWETACEQAKEMRSFHPAIADYWLGRTLENLEDKSGAVQAYESALSQQLLYPVYEEVDKIMRRLKDRRRKGYGV